MVRTPPEVPYNTTLIIGSILTIQVTIIVTGVVPPCSNVGNGTICRIQIIIAIVSRELHSVNCDSQDCHLLKQNYTKVKNQFDYLRENSSC